MSLGKIFGRGSREREPDQHTGIYEIPKVLATDALILTLQKHYPKLRVISTDERTTISLIYSALPPEEQLNLALDLTFFSQNPKLPLENLCSRLTNYHPKNASQQELLYWANQLLLADSTTTGSGLFIYGEPGVGKTHTAVGLAKELMRKGSHSNYVNADDWTQVTDLQLAPNQVWILDDLNSPYGEGMKAFKRIVLNAHNVGGKIFVTGNQHYDELMEHAFVGDEGNRQRYLDRSKGMFKILHVTGESERQRTAWHTREY